MGDVINLRAARKRKAAVEKSALAEQNRARVGRTKAQKRADAEDVYRRTKLLDDSKLE